ncbi:ABC transporter permease [Caenibacillus caldisaponilyticus]|uniref:ABC transporter permease n=1 Tax=Caenibacillus caldisaponilyticus TaxID=1674942 RepID=UPI00098874C1|nr:ABC transporter permease [Caenibacillus caldisaponilyticus]
MKSSVFHEINAVVAIAARDITRSLKSIQSLVISLIFPLIFVGLMGETMNQNMGQGLGFNFLQYMLVGMVVNTLYQVTIAGISNLVEDRQNDFTQEIFVAPISRYAIILGKIIGSSFSSLFQLVGLVAIALILNIPLGGWDFVRLLLLSPAICLSAGALGILLVGFVQDQRTAQILMPLVIFPQMFLSGALIPVNHSTGILNFLSHIIPMTYVVDLAKAVFYWRDPAYDKIVMHSPMLDVWVMAGFFFVFSILGTVLFARAERNR